MVSLGVLLIIIGLLLPGWGVLVTVGLVLFIAGLLVNFVPFGGRRYRVW